MNIAIGIAVTVLWLLAIVASTELGWKMRPVRAAMLFMLTAEYRLNAFVQELEARMEARK